MSTGMAIREPEPVVALATANLTMSLVKDPALNGAAFRSVRPPASTNWAMKPTSSASMSLVCSPAARTVVRRVWWPPKSAVWNFTVMFGYLALKSADLKTSAYAFSRSP